MFTFHYAIERFHMKFKTYNFLLILKQKVYRFLPEIIGVDLGLHC